MAISLPEIEGWTEYTWNEILGQGEYAWYANQHGETTVVRAEDIESVLWMHCDQEDSWSDNTYFACVVALTSGEFAMCEAWHDLTGWDCQAGVTWKVAPTLAGAVRELSQVHRDRFNETKVTPL